ncbi:MAG TPA: hypothetical protein VFB03_03905 [Candidatus Saccharimonadales bacterium]|nr:hypothetical protein [Candidatus Saccharimonadales bacterium]
MADPEVVKFAPIYHEIIYPTIHEVLGTATKLGKAIVSSGVEINQIIPITRGGAAPFLSVSREVDVESYDILGVKGWKLSSDGVTEVPSNRLRVYQRPERINPKGEKTLFIDDLHDKGRTARYVRRNWPRSLFAVLYSKLSAEETMKFVDFCGRLIGQVWVRFPYDEQRESNYTQMEVEDYIKWRQEESNVVPLISPRAARIAKRQHKETLELAA